MNLPEDTVDELVKRLRRIEGQVRGIQQMLREERECRDVVAQVSAASTALDQVGFKLLAAGLTRCISDPVEAARNGFDIAEVEKLFLRLA